MSPQNEKNKTNEGSESQRFFATLKIAEFIERHPNGARFERYRLTVAAKGGDHVLPYFFNARELFYCRMVGACVLRFTGCVIENLYSPRKWDLSLARAIEAGLCLHPTSVSPSPEIVSPSQSVPEQGSRT